MFARIGPAISETASTVESSLKDLSRRHTTEFRYPSNGHVYAS